jgi:hypothetical protein
MILTSELTMMKFLLISANFSEAATFFFNAIYIRFKMFIEKTGLNIATLSRSRFVVKAQYIYTFASTAPGFMDNEHHRFVTSKTMVGILFIHCQHFAVFENARPSNYLVF